MAQQAWAKQAASTARQIHQGSALDPKANCASTWQSR